MMKHADNPEERPQTLFRGKFLELVKEGRWEYVRRVNANGAVMVIAVTEEGELLLVEEYRFPLHARTIGLPAGLSGDGGEESTLESARRELEEETGYSASFWTYLFTGPSSPGLTTEMVSFYLADGLRQVAEGGGVDNEDITVHRIPLSLVHDWLMDQTGQGKVVDPKIFMGLYFLFHRFDGSDREEG
ncbi:NUDIX hydrolase [uncultured Akkermansia sp.]|uniref:NUDIX hydrolase n=1 Tax=Akkermansia sp. TaxID=1872421 RepID=UPI0025E2B923|nr:NUDIX hydrolase [uncultured Akkermansia sp.]